MQYSTYNRKSRLFATSLIGLASLGLVGTSLAAERIAPIGVDVPSVVYRSMLMGHAQPSKMLHVSVSLPVLHPEELQAFVDSVSNPKSADYHKFITPTEVGAQFGQTAADVQKVVDFLHAKNFTVKLVGENHFTILADCTVHQAEKAFNTTINVYHAFDGNEPGNQDYISYSTPIQIQKALAPLVSDVTGLESYTRPQARTTLTPSMARVLYNVVPLYNNATMGEGRTVGISNWDGFRVSNVPIFYSTFSLPSPSGGAGSNVRVVPISGGAGGGTPAGEGDLDIQMPLGMSPLANLVVYDGGSFDMIGVLTTEANENAADIISESWGWNIPSSTAIAAHNLHLAMNAQGITYMNAAGDSGTSIEPFSYPDYEPEVLQIGGTEATTDGIGNRTNEVVWPGGGGGWSTNAVSFNQRGTYQTGGTVPTDIGFRIGPDVALQASSAQGAFSFIEGGAISAGDGTSFSSPIFAGCLAEVEALLILEGKLPPLPSGKFRLGRINDIIYGMEGRADVFHDITQGNNGTLPNGTASNAKAGWDYASGYGSLDFDAFEKAMTFVPPTVISPETATIFMGIGTGATGSAANLVAKDNVFYTINTITQAGVGQVAAAELHFQLTGNYSKASLLKLTLAGKGVATTTAYTYFYNFKTGNWDINKTLGMTAGDKLFNLNLTGAGNYINSNGKVYMIVRALKPARLQKNSFAFRLDQAIITENF